MLQKLALIAAAGAIGTLARCFLQAGVQNLTAGQFPWGTLAVNLLGCFLYGFVFALAEGRMVISSETRIVLLAGFMGAFTTFSTFGFETAALLESGHWHLAIANVFAQNGLGLAAVFAGLAIGRAV